MKPVLFSISLIIAFTFISCEDVQFRRPQPVGEVSISSFQNEYIGTYKNGTSYLLVSKNSFTQVNFVPEKKVVTGILDDNCILKNYKGKYIISLKIDTSDYWHVANFKLDHDGLTVYSIHEEEDIPILKKHTAVSVTEKEDSRIYKIDPTYEEFSKIVAEGIFKMYDNYDKYSSDIKSHKEMTAIVEKSIAEAEEENK